MAFRPFCQKRNEQGREESIDWFLNPFMTFEPCRKIKSEITNSGYSEGCTVAHEFVKSCVFWIVAHLLENICSRPSSCRDSDVAWHDRHQCHGPGWPTELGDGSETVPLARHPAAKVSRSPTGLGPRPGGPATRRRRRPAAGAGPPGRARRPAGVGHGGPARLGG